MNIRKESVKIVIINTSERTGGAISGRYGNPHARGHGGGGTPHLCQGLQERARQGRQEHRRCGGCTV